MVKACGVEECFLFGVVVGSPKPSNQTASLPTPEGGGGGAGSVSFFEEGFLGGLASV